MRTVIYPGTFDPITNGHIDIIDRARRLFDNVVVAIGVNVRKTTLFSEDEREELTRMALEQFDNVEVRRVSGLTVAFAEAVGATAIVRGLRFVSDFEYEMQMALMNRKMKNDISTVFLMPHENYTYLNSSIIREMTRYGADVSAFVPECVAEALDRKRLQGDVGE